MGFFKSEEEVRKAREEALEARREARDALNSMPDAGLGFGKGKLPDFVTEFSYSGKLPSDVYERDFILALDRVVSSGSSSDLQELVDLFVRKGLSSSRFAGFNKEGLMKHLGITIKRYRPDIYLLLKKAAGKEDKGGMEL